MAGAVSAAFGDFNHPWRQLADGADSAGVERFPRRSADLRVHDSADRIHVQFCGAARGAAVAGV